MVEFDPYLYVAFGVGLLAGWVVRPRSPWVPRATLVSVGVLIGLFGATLDAIPLDRLLETIPEALGLVLAMLGLTAGVVLLLFRWTASVGPTAPVPSGPPDRWPLSPLLLGALVGGFLLARFVYFPAAAAIPWALYTLLALVAFDLQLRWAALRTLWVPVTSAVVGAVIAAILLTSAFGVAAPVAFATTLAFGWYSLAGPLVAARAGAELGLFAFLTNFLREDFTLLFAPLLGRRLRGEGLAAFGGATAMDTTLYMVTRYGDPKAGSLALATGLLLTVAASLLLPFLLSLP